MVPAYVGPALAAIGIGSVALISGARRFARTAVRADWPTVTGLVVRSDVDRAPTARPWMRPTPAVRVEYRVSGQAYEI